jgi:hypothetical protein
MTTVCVGFSTAKGPGGLVSRLICWLVQSPASHVWLLYYDELLASWLVLEAHETGYRIVPFPFFKRKNNIVCILRPSHSLLVGLPESAQWLGSHYDFAGLFGMIVVVLGRILKRTWRNPFRSSRAQFCSEAVTRILHAAKYPGATVLHPDDCDPRQLFYFLKRTSEEWQPEART